MSKTLLVVDDAMIIREMVKDAAQDAGWTVVGEATNGHEAVEKFKELMPDVMTLDVVMPEYDGLYAAREILAAFPEARIVLVTAMDQDAILAEARSLGVQQAITKPFQKNDLLDALGNAKSQAATTRNSNLTGTH